MNASRRVESKVPNNPSLLRRIAAPATAVVVISALLLASCALTGRDREAFSSETSEEGKATCDEPLQDRIDAASPGSTVTLAEDCVYRESVIVDKPLTLEGSGSGEIRGSDVWDGWTESGSRWTSSQSVPDLSLSSRYRCEAESRQCLMPEQVFRDGEPLEQVARNPGSGQFAIGDGRRVILADDPTDHLIEVTVRKTWLEGRSDDVTVSGVVMKHAASDGLWNGGYSNWIVEDSDLSYAHAANLKLTLGTSLVARDNDLHEGGQMGLASNDAEIEIVGNRLYRNNTERFDPLWEAGGMKISQPVTTLISQNEVYDNGDIGIWTDTVNARQRSVEISGNRVHHNPRQGIRVEITKNFDVSDNMVWENGWGTGDSYEGTGITVAGSRRGEVNDNILAWNASGIAVVQQDRKGADEQSYDIVRRVRLNRNEIIQTEIPGSLNHAAVVWNDDSNAIAGGAPSIYETGTSNGGEDNRYWFSGSAGDTDRFKWSSKFERLDAYNETPAEDGGVYLSDAEKDSILREHDLPAAPEGRGDTDSAGITATIMNTLQRWISEILGARQ